MRIHRPIIKILIYSSLFLCNLDLCAQPSIEWERPLGGSNTDCGYSVIQLPDSNYMAVGHCGSSDGDATFNHGDLDVWVTKLDQKGNLLWQKSYGGYGREEGYVIRRTVDGNFYIGATTFSRDGDVTGNHGVDGYDDFWILKIDGSGNIIWQKCFGGTKGDELYSICLTPDGGLIACGETSSADGDVSVNKNGLGNAWVIKVSSQGVLEWEHSYGGTDIDRAYSISMTKDGNYIFAGNTYSNDGDISFNHQYGYSDAWIVKIDPRGDILWSKTFGGTKPDGFNSIEQNADGDYVAAGYTFSSDGDISNSHGNGEAWIVKVDNNGNLISSKTYGGSLDEIIGCIHQLKDHTYVFVGQTTSKDGEVTGKHGQSQLDCWIGHLTEDGTLDLETAIGGIQEDVAVDFIPTLDGKFILTGSTFSSDGDVIIKPGFHNPNDTSDFWVVKFAIPCKPTNIDVYLKGDEVINHVGDSLDIPVYFKPDQPSTLSYLNSLLLDFSMNTDFINPVRFIPSLQGLSVSQIVDVSQGVSINFNLSNSQFLSTEIEIGVLRCATYLTDTLESSVTLAGSTGQTNCITLSSSNSINVRLSYQCGDSVLSNFIKYDSLIFKVLSIVPNPAQNSISVHFSNEDIIYYEIFDALGIVRKKGIYEGRSLDLDVSDLPVGNYYLRCSNSAGIQRRASVSIMR